MKEIGRRKERIPSPPGSANESVNHTKLIVVIVAWWFLFFLWFCQIYYDEISRKHNVFNIIKKVIIGYSQSYPSGLIGATPECLSLK